MTEGPGIVGFFGTDRTADESLICRDAARAVLSGKALTGRAGLTAATGFTPEKTDTLLDGLGRRGLVVVEQSSGRVVGAWR
jgi:hypothetical protein